MEHLTNNQLAIGIVIGNHVVALSILFLVVFGVRFWSRRQQYIDRKISNWNSILNRRKTQ